MVAGATGDKNKEEEAAAKVGIRSIDECFERRHCLFQPRAIRRRTSSSTNFVIIYFFKRISRRQNKININIDWL